MQILIFLRKRTGGWNRRCWNEKRLRRGRTRAPWSSIWKMLGNRDVRWLGMNEIRNSVQRMRFMNEQVSKNQRPNFANLASSSCHRSILFTIPVISQTLAADFRLVRINMTPFGTIRKPIEIGFCDFSIGFRMVKSTSYSERYDVAELIVDLSKGFRMSLFPQIYN